MFQSACLARWKAGFGIPLALGRGGHGVWFWAADQARSVEATSLTCAEEGEVFLGRAAAAARHRVSGETANDRGEGRHHRWRLLRYPGDSARTDQ